MTDLQKADARARRQAIVAVVAIAAIGAAAIVFINFQFSATNPLTLGTLAAATLAPLAGFAAYFWILGARIVRAERFPAPGMPVIRDTPMLEGGAARGRGRVLQVLAILLLVALAVIVALSWQLVQLLQ